MGTRSLTVFLDELDREIVVMHRQMDGYPDGHGIDLAEFLKQFKVVNGIPVGETAKIANGANCLAALTISYFKEDTPGNIYLHAAGSRDLGEEYIYYVKVKTGEPIKIKVVDCYSEKETDFMLPNHLIAVAERLFQE